MKRIAKKLGLPVFGVSREALARIMEYSWPGNIRELENCIERAMILTDGDEISLASLPGQLRSIEPSSAALEIGDDDLSIKHHTKAIEEQLIKKALEQTGGNRTHAAKLLDISHRTLLYKLKEYGLGQ